MKLFSSIITYFLIGLFSFSFVAFAQISSVEKNISVTITPDIPGPSEEVVIEVESFISDLNRAEIKWLVDGKTAQKGRGLKVLRFTNGFLGTKTSITVIIDTQEGVHIERVFTFQPALVDIMWEADTYTPPFYRGKALPTSKSSITLVAIPQLTVDGKKILDPNSFIYTWSKDRRVLGKQSGFGKQSITITAPLLFQNSHIKVVVTSFGGSLTAKKEMFVVTGEPQILFYQKHPLEGVLYNKALRGIISLTDEEITLRAEPYFFSKDSLKSGDLDFLWSLNGKPFNSGDTQNEATLRQTGETGTAQVRLEVVNLKKLLQSAGSVISLRFGFDEEFRF